METPYSNALSAFTFKSNAKVGHADIMQSCRKVWEREPADLLLVRQVMSHRLMSSGLHSFIVSVILVGELIHDLGITNVMLHCSTVLSLVVLHCLLIGWVWCLCIPSIYKESSVHTSQTISHHLLLHHMHTQARWLHDRVKTAQIQKNKLKKSSFSFLLIK